MSRRQLFRDFDGMTCIAAALGIVFLAVIVEAGLRADFQRQKGQSDDANAVYRIEPGQANRPETQPSGGRAATRPAFRLSPVSHDDGGTGHVGRRQTFNVSAYCPCKKCCGPNAKGITASGALVSIDGGRFVAADRSVPFGTRLRIPGYAGGNIVRVRDRGGAIKGNRLDVFFNTHQAALNFGRKTLTVEIYQLLTRNTTTTAGRRIPSRGKKG